MVNNEHNTLGVLKCRGVRGGGGDSCFILTHDNPLPNLMALSNWPTNYSGVMDYIRYSENIPPDNNTRIRMCECFI